MQALDLRKHPAVVQTEGALCRERDIQHGEGDESAGGMTGRVQHAAGGGITARSDPAAEYAETLHKAEGMLRVLASFGAAPPVAEAAP